MRLVNPSTKTVVVASGDIAERLVQAGFKPAEPPAAPRDPSEDPKRRPGRPKKS